MNDIQEKDAAASKCVPASQPKIHIVFPSTEENSQEAPTEGQGRLDLPSDDAGPSAVPRSRYVG